MTMSNSTNLTGLRAFASAAGIAWLAMLTPSLAAQNLIQDHRFQSSAAWTSINSLTQVVAWGPMQLETRVTNSADANKVVGVRQTVVVPAKGYYQLRIHVDTRQLGQTGGVRFDCYVASGTTRLLTASGYANEGPDTRMATALLDAGTYTVNVTSTTVQDQASSYYRLVGNACFLEAVSLPVPNWYLESALPRSNQRFEIRGSFSATSDSAIYLFAANVLPRGVPVPGFNGLLWLDPASPGGIIVTNLVPKNQVFWIYPWPLAWPRVHCQVLELKTTGTLELRLGSAVFSQY